MAKRIEVKLFGAQGQRSVEVTTHGGFSTRHIKAPRANTIPSIFSPVTPDMVAAARKARHAQLPTTPVKQTVPSPAPDFARNIESHKRCPKLWDADGRPKMAVAQLDEFIQCQELVAPNVDYREFYNAAMHAKRRSCVSGTVEECVGWCVLAVRCLNISNRLKERKPKRKTKPRSQPEKPKTDLRALLAKVDAILDKGETS